jgi:hypothetical protein
MLSFSVSYICYLHQSRLIYPVRGTGEFQMGTDPFIDLGGILLDPTKDGRMVD